MAFLRKSHQRTQFTLYMLNYGSYIMPGLKTGDNNYNMKSHVVLYLNKEQRRQNLEAHFFLIPTAFFSFREPLLDLLY